MYIVQLLLFYIYHLLWVLYLVDMCFLFMFDWVTLLLIHNVKDVNFDLTFAMQGLHADRELLYLLSAGVNFFFLTM